MTLTIEQLLYLHKLVGADMIARYSGASGNGPDLAFERELLHLLNAEIGKIAMPAVANIVTTIPPSGVHDATCKFVCKEPKDSCVHRCTVCAAKKRCPFCHAPSDKPCMTVLYEGHIEHGNGKVRTHFHEGRIKQ